MSERPPVAAVVLAQDEASHILPCLRTLQWAAELLVVDSGSTDGTPDLARSLGARVVQHDWAGWAAQRDFALTQVSQPWVFFVDADERVPLDLAEEVAARVDPRAGVGDETAPAGYWVPRQNFLLGHWVRHAGWAPDYQLRLFRRDRGRYDPQRPVHELVILDGPAGYLQHRLVHHNYTTWGQFWTRQRRYARAEAAALAARGVRAKPRNFVLQPLRELQRRVWTLRGYRAGPLGLQLSAALAVAELWKYVDLWRLAGPSREDVRSSVFDVRRRDSLDFQRRTSNFERGTSNVLAPSVTAVVVSFEVAPLLARCLASLRRAGAELAARGDRLETVVVDNASADGSADLVRREFPAVRLIANAQNAGYGAACNQGAAGAGEFVLFLNPDAELRAGALPALLERARAAPRAGLVGPRVTYPDGRPQPTRRRFPTLAALLVESTPLEWRGPPWPALRRYHMVDQPDGRPRPVDWLSGACLLARTAAFRQVGGFAPDFFMYFEEVDLARRLAAYGWETWYEPTAQAVHHHSRSADRDPQAKDRHFYRSKYRFVATYWGGVAAGALRLAAGLSFTAETAVQLARRDRRLAGRDAALVRLHFT